MVCLMYVGGLKVRSGSPDRVFADLVDGAMELSVLASFSAIGPAARSRLYHWELPGNGALVGQTALVTGPTSGLGRLAAHRLAELGARVVLLGRDSARLAEVRQELAQSTGEDRYSMVVADMSSVISVRRAVQEVMETEPRLDILVDNAGAIHPERTDTDEGIEATLAVLVVGPFTLIAGLMPMLLAAPAGRVICVTSGGMYAQGVDLGDLEWRHRPYSGVRAYAQGKRIQVALVREWARRLAGANVSVNAMHPGWADTPGLANSLPGFYGLMRPLLRSPELGVDTITWLATADSNDAPGGRLYLDRRPRPFDRLPATRLSAADRQELWEQISELAGVDPAVAERAR